MISRYRMPAEWELHEGTLVSWPVKTSVVYPENFDELCEGYLNVILSIADFEPVYVLVNESDIQSVQKRCHHTNVHCIKIEHDDAWVRDNGSTYVIDEQTKKVNGIHWRFNAWGEKYPEYEKDSIVAPKVNEALGYSTLQENIVLEGGSIHVNGAGTLLTTAQCLLNPNRNPQMTQKEIETILKKRLGVQHIIWLEEGIYGDETDGHIDNIACFVDEKTILIQVCKNPDDPNYAISQKALEVLENAVDCYGEEIKYIMIESPPSRYYKGEHLALSYLNFYLVNGGVILPVFGDDAKDYDAKAIAMIQNIYPDRKIITIDGMALIKEGGNVHCITQQIPKEVKKNG